MIMKTMSEKGSSYWLVGVGNPDFQALLIGTDGVGTQYLLTYHEGSPVFDPRFSLTSEGWRFASPPLMVNGANQFGSPSGSFGLTSTRLDSDFNLVEVDNLVVGHDSTVVFGSPNRANGIFTFNSDSSSEVLYPNVLYGVTHGSQPVKWQSLVPEIPGTPNLPVQNARGVVQGIVMNIQLVFITVTNGVGVYLSVKGVDPQGNAKYTLQGPKTVKEITDQEASWLTRNYSGSTYDPDSVWYIGETLGNSSVRGFDNCVQGQVCGFNNCNGSCPTGEICIHNTEGKFVCKTQSGDNLVIVIVVVVAVIVLLVLLLGAFHYLHRTRKDMNSARKTQENIARSTLTSAQ